MSIRLALAGNPNSGKTTMFNALTGSNQRVGNWPGVTVEKKEGRLKADKDITLTDLPGIYSLSPYTLEEVVAREYLVGERPDGIINIVDATNIERNLYLTTQLMEMGIPVVVALNMMDLVRKNGDDRRGQAVPALGCPVVEVSALKGEGLDKLLHGQNRRAEVRPRPAPFRPGGEALDTSSRCSPPPSPRDGAVVRREGVRAGRPGDEQADAVRRRQGRVEQAARL